MKTNAIYDHELKDFFCALGVSEDRRKELEEETKKIMKTTSLVSKTLADFINLANTPEELAILSMKFGQIQTHMNLFDVDPLAAIMIMMKK